MSTDGGLGFVLDAGAAARIYLRDVATRSMRDVYARFPGRMHAPAMLLSEVTAAWLNAIRDERTTWHRYRRLCQAFQADTEEGVIRLWGDERLHQAAVDVQEELTRLYLDGRRHGSLVHTRDAYYVGLARQLRAETGDRVILITNDAKVWRGARALGLEVFHGNTCDLGIGRAHVGRPGSMFPQGANCAPCGIDGCPSTFQLDLDEPPLHLGSGVPSRASA